MRINTNQPAFNPEDATTKIVRTDSAHTTPPSANSTPSAASSISVLAYSVVPSFELFNLTGAMAQIPAVRQDALAQTIQRLAAGDLQDLSAIDQTANVILGR